MPDRITRTETNDKGEECEREIPFMKGYTVFNAEQCDGLPAQYTANAEAPALPPLARIERADRFFAATGANIRHGGTRAYYAEGPDYVQMPPFETFRDAESHAATLAHELTHWTKHGKRLARDMGRIRWGDEGYAKEELVAELGAAFLCADLEITPEVRDDHAAYIGHSEGVAGRQTAEPVQQTDRSEPFEERADRRPAIGQVPPQPACRRRSRRAGVRMPRWRRPSDATQPSARWDVRHPLGAHPQQLGLCAQKVLGAVSRRRGAHRHAGDFRMQGRESQGLRWVCSWSRSASSGDLSIRRARRGLGSFAALVGIRVVLTGSGRA
jgi:hypothetical protein